MIKEATVVWIRDLLCGDPGAGEVVQLPGKRVLVEKILQLLVRHVDAQLLKRVFPLIFKPEDVEDSDFKPLLCLCRGSEARVDFCNNPSKQPGVDELGSCVPAVFGLLQRFEALDALASHLGGGDAELRNEVADADLCQIGDVAHGARCLHSYLVAIIVRLEADVAHVKDNRDHGLDLGYLQRLKPRLLHDLQEILVALLRLA